MAIDADGRFSGYASVFGRIDQGGDIVMPGAFRESLSARGTDRVRLLFQHDPKEPIGLWDEIVEDRFGLKVSGRLLDGVPRATSLKALIAQRAIVQLARERRFSVCRKRKYCRSSSSLSWSGETA